LGEPDLFLVLLAMKMKLGRTAARFPFFKARLKKESHCPVEAQGQLTRQIFHNSVTVRSFQRRIHSSPEVTVIFGTARVALDMLVPPRINWQS
jgi:hypothetical protein